MSESFKEKELLKKLYECQDMMEILLDEGKNDEHYILMTQLIERLEKYLINDSGNIGL
jgi:hypothetical protein